MLMGPCYSSHHTGHAATIATLSYAIRFWSKGTKRALFLRHEGFLYVFQPIFVSPPPSAFADLDVLFFSF